jgi:hypothetical protein
MAWNWTTSRTGSGTGVWDLAQDATMRLPRGRSGVVARAERGTLVVTQAGDPEDHVLRPGEEVRLPRGGLAVAWALTPSVLAVRDPRPERAGAAPPFAQGS